MKGITNSGHEALEAYADPDAEKEAGPEIKEATRKYSNLALTCFCFTIGAIALLLAGLLIARDPKALAVKGIVVSFIAAIAVFISICVTLRLVRKAR